MTTLTSAAIVQASNSPGPSPGQRPRSPLPSPRRERPPLKSSPLAGPSYASDGAGRIVQQSSALDEEIARRRSHLFVGLDDEELARLASLSHSPARSVETFSSVPGPSRQNSTSDSSAEASIGEAPSKRKVRPSFISLAPPCSPSLSSQLPAPPPLRNRHSSPNINLTQRPASLDAPLPPLPTRPRTADNQNANWMTSAPAPSFSRSAMHTRGVVLPVKSAQRIRRKSMPSAPTSSRHLVNKPPVPALPVGEKPKHDMGEINIDAQEQPARRKKSTRSLRSVKSLGRLFHHSHEEKEADPLPPVPPLPTTPSRSRTTSMGSGVSVQMPITPPDSAPPFSTSNPTLNVSPTPAAGETQEGKVKRLWTRVVHGVKKMK
ncbi:hypothetical protein FRC07_011291 [Ceratobasidium sp. 392]|nr:hypothetical protein FRC07_011291 [Ceratobasidium sp. 392]